MAVSGCRWLLKVRRRAAAAGRRGARTPGPQRSRGPTAQEGAAAAHWPFVTGTPRMASRSRKGPLGVTWALVRARMARVRAHITFRRPLYTGRSNIWDGTEFALRPNVPIESAESSLSIGFGLVKIRCILRKLGGLEISSHPKCLCALCNFVKSYKGCLQEGIHKRAPKGR